MPRPFFPPVVDNTILSTFRSCPHKTFRQYLQHWKPKGQSVHLVAGGAFAVGMEAARVAFFVNHDPAPLAIAKGVSALIAYYGDFECPVDSAKSLERTLGAFEFYFDNYPLGEDGATPVYFSPGNHGIEFSFAEPLDVLHPTTGEPIIYAGRADMIAEFAGGVYLFDEKTTSSLGASWAEQWHMSSQFSGYSWAAAKAGFPVQGTVVRGVSILKTKYDTQAPITYRADWEIDRWLLQTHRDLKRMITLWEEGYWDYNLGHACSEYGGCALRQVCKSADPEPWLDMYMERKVWDPLTRKETSVEEWEAGWSRATA